MIFVYQDTYIAKKFFYYDRIETIEKFTEAMWFRRRSNTTEWKFVLKFVLTLHENITKLWNWNRIYCNSVWTYRTIIRKYSIIDFFRNVEGLFSFNTPYLTKNIQHNVKVYFTICLKSILEVKYIKHNKKTYWFIYLLRFYTWYMCM